MDPPPRFGVTAWLLGQSFVYRILQLDRQDSYVGFLEHARVTPWNFVYLNALS